MKMPGGDFHIKCMNERQYEEIFERAFSWLGCELSVHACFNKAEIPSFNAVEVTASYRGEKLAFI